MLPRQPGQGGIADPPIRDLRAQLLQAEAAHLSKKRGSSLSKNDQSARSWSTEGKPEADTVIGGDVESTGEDSDTKRRRILEETREIDADSEGSGSDSNDGDRSVFTSADLASGN